MSWAIYTEGTRRSLWPEPQSRQAKTGEGDEDRIAMHQYAKANTRLPIGRRRGARNRAKKGSLAEIEINKERPGALGDHGTSRARSNTDQDGAARNLVKGQIPGKSFRYSHAALSRRVELIRRRRHEIYSTRIWRS